MAGAAIRAYRRHRAALVAASVLMLGGLTLQDRLLYFPTRAARADLVSERMRAWPEPDDFRGLVAEPPGRARATAIVFHGNAGHVGDRGMYADALTPLGVRVILAEYPGYGPRDGAPNEQALVADAERTVALARRLYPGPLLLVGESLGAGVAAAAAARDSDRLAGLLLITPWDRLENVAAHHYPRWLVRKLLRDPYDNVARLASFDRRVLVAVAARDSIVPARFGVALYETLPGPKRLSVLDGADHNDWPAYVDRHWWRDAVSYLLDKHP